MKFLHFAIKKQAKKSTHPPGRDFQQINPIAGILSYLANVLGKSDINIPRFSKLQYPQQQNP